MRITILAIGSRGDVEPFVALGVGLKQSGDSVRLLALEDFRAFVEAQGLEFASFQGDLRGVVSSNLVESGRGLSMLAELVQRLLAHLSERLFLDVGEACRDADLILVTPLALLALDLIETLGIPVIFATHVPVTPTRSFPYFLLFRSLPRSAPFRFWYHRVTYTLGLEIPWPFFRWGINRALRNLPRIPRCRRESPFRRYFRERRAVLCGFSPSVIPPPPDWGEHVHVTGYWFLPSSGWSPSPDLERFLASGPPPVFIGFGSMIGRNPGAVTELVVQALSLAGQRGILVAGSGGLEKATSLPKEIFLVETVPYEWLFSRVSAVVHHGGAGSTAAGLRAGLPSVVVPGFGDQFFWGERVVTLGVGPPPVPRRRLTAKRLALAIRAALEDQEMRARAALLGQTIQREDGVARAVEILHQQTAQVRS